MRRDPRIAYVLAYGSLTQGTADEFSDAEYYCWSGEPLEVAAWLRETLLGTPWQVLHAFVNDFGTPNFVLTGLLRVELHSQPVSGLEQILDWPNENLRPEAMLVKDMDGRLNHLLGRLLAKNMPVHEADAQVILDRLVGWLCFGCNVLRRGERIRAEELLWWVRGGLLRLARLQEGALQHWLAPSRLVEQELSHHSLTQYAKITGSLDDLGNQYKAAWQWTLSLQSALGLHIHAELRNELDSLFAPPVDVSLR